MYCSQVGLDWVGMYNVYIESRIERFFNRIEVV